MNQFGKLMQTLNGAQRKAVELIDGPLLVIAGPGTGKTQLLTLRIANILKKTDTPPSSILCLTFTDAAANAMRERLTSIIGQAAFDVNISTYHAFGSEIIRQNPEYFISDRELRPIDDLTADNLIREIQSKLPYSNPLKFELYIRDIKSLIADCKEATLTPIDIKHIAKSNQEFIKQASKLSRQKLAQLNVISSKSVNMFEQLLSASSNLPSESPAVNTANLSKAWAFTLSDAISQFRLTHKTTGLSLWKSQWLMKNEDNQWIVRGEDQVKKMLSFSDIYENYTERLNVLGVYDYQDMILKVIRGFENNNELLQTQQEKYLYFLLDEYQDTNEAQATLVNFLTDTQVSEGRPNVMAVGDDDQAIYAFQGADYSHMLHFYNHYVGCRVIPLVINYRSNDEIVDFSGKISQQIQERLIDFLPNITKDIKSSVKTSNHHDPSIERYEFVSELSQYSWVAHQVARLVKAGELANDIAVLSPKHEYLEALVPFMHSEGLKLSYEKKENILDDRVIEQLILMSKLIVAIRDKDFQTSDYLWPQILSMSFWALPTSKLWSLSWSASDNKTNWLPELLKHEDVRNIALFFIKLAQQSNYLTLEEIMDFLIGTSSLDVGEPDINHFTSPFYKHYFGDSVLISGEAEDYWQLLSNITVLRQHLRDYKSWEMKPIKIDDLINFSEALKAAGLTLINTNPHQESTNSVQLMTAYKSKGQEFETVFILGAIDEIWGNRARNLGNRISLPENIKYVRYAGMNEDERLRLLYVAITRAKNMLYLTSFLNTFSGKQTTRLKYLDEREEAGAMISPLLPLRSRQIRRVDQALPKQEELTLYWNKKQTSKLDLVTLRAVLKPKLKEIRLSPTMLNCFLDIVSNGPNAFFKRHVLKFPMASSAAAEFGSAIHETLDWANTYAVRHNEVPNDKLAVQRFEKQLLKKQLSDTNLKLLLTRGTEALKQYLASNKEAISAKGYTEYGFRRQRISINGVPITGKIDKIIIDSKKREIRIIDYKTGKSYQKWTKDTRLHLYTNQLYFYRLLVNNSNPFANYLVSDAILDFVEPDAMGKIRQLHLKYNSESQDRLISLISAIWKHIKDLDFPTTDHYQQNLKGIVDFENDLIEGKI